MSSQKHGHPLKITATFLNETNQPSSTRRLIIQCDKRHTPRRHRQITLRRRVLSISRFSTPCSLFSWF